MQARLPVVRRHLLPWLRRARAKARHVEGARLRWARGEVKVVYDVVVVVSPCVDVDAPHVELQGRPVLGSITELRHGQRPSSVPAWRPSGCGPTLLT